RAKERIAALAKILEADFPVKPDFVLVVITVLVALIFDFLNGFHDSANSIATVVSTRVLSPKLAVLWAAAFNFLAAFFLGTAVAKTIRSEERRVGKECRSRWWRYH